MTKQQQTNGYDDEDFKNILDEIEGYEAEKRSVASAAAGKSSALSKKIAVARKTATKLNIPSSILSGVLKQRKLEKQLQDIADGIPEDLAEVYEDAAGQFSFLAPTEEDEPKKAKPAEIAAKRAKKAAQANQEREQEEGTRVLDELGAKH